jgi:sulfur carrier protein ThiS
MGCVEVTTLGLLRARLPEGCSVEADQTVAQAIQALGLDLGEGLVPLVNGRLASWGDLLRDGDRLELVQSVGGGD